MQVNVKKLHPEAKVPTYAHHDDAGMDFYIVEEVTIGAGEQATLPTGIALAIPDGYVGLIWEKSGLAFKYGIQLLGGVIDAGYRGEIRMRALNTSKEDHTFHKGDKIGQMLLQKVDQAKLVEVDELEDTSRGDGAFGSTGKN